MFAINYPNTFRSFGSAWLVFGGWELIGLNFTWNKLDRSRTRITLITFHVLIVCCNLSIFHVELKPTASFKVSLKWSSVSGVIGRCVFSFYKKNILRYSRHDCMVRLQQMLEIQYRPMRVSNKRMHRNSLLLVSLSNECIGRFQMSVQAFPFFKRNTFRTCWNLRAQYIEMAECRDQD